MTLQAKYKEYLRAPSVDALAANASLNYIPTTTALTQASAILKHLQAQQQLVEKKKETFLNVIEGSNGLCVETETTLHFSQAGGAYLLNLDDNFISGKTITLPITHIVMFDDEQKIQQIRLLWDQGSLLKAVDTIGARGRNWPIRDTTDQLKMIVSSAEAAPAVAEEERAGRRITRASDPHSSLKLFAPREITTREESPQHSVAPRASAKPAPREWNELFAGEAAPERSPSPVKRDRENSNPLKAGAGKHFQEPRLFNQGAPDAEDPLKEKGIKTDARKYEHFEFGMPVVPPKSAETVAKNKSKHSSQWDFTDFSTPVKPPSRKIDHHRPTHTFESDSGETPRAPVYRQVAPQPRPDANAHFQFDDTVPDAEHTTSSGRPASSASTGGLYEDHVLGAYHNSSNRNTVGNGNGAETDDGYEDRPLKDITNPSQNNTNGRPLPGAKSHVPVPRAQDRHWDLFDSSPAPVEQERGIKIHGDGMGKRKHGEKNWWDYE